MSQKYLYKRCWTSLKRNWDWVKVLRVEFLEICFALNIAVMSREYPLYNCPSSKKSFYDGSSLTLKQSSPMKNLGRFHFKIKIQKISNTVWAVRRRSLPIKQKIQYVPPMLGSSNGFVGELHGNSNSSIIVGWTIFKSNNLLSKVVWSMYAIHLVDMSHVQ